MSITSGEGQLHRVVCGEVGCLHQGVDGQSCQVGRKLVHQGGGGVGEGNLYPTTRWGKDSFIRFVGSLEASTKEWWSGCQVGRVQRSATREITTV